MRTPRTAALLLQTARPTPTSPHTTPRRTCACGSSRLTTFRVGLAIGGRAPLAAFCRRMLADRDGRITQARRGTRRRSASSRRPGPSAACARASVLPRTGRGSARASRGGGPWSSWRRCAARESWGRGWLLTLRGAAGTVPQQVLACFACASRRARLRPAAADRGCGAVGLYAGAYTFRLLLREHQAAKNSLESCSREQPKSGLVLRRNAALLARNLRYTFCIYTKLNR